MKLTSDSGDHVEMVDAPEGLGFLVLPAKPPFEELVVDVFQVGLNLASLARLRAALRNGERFETHDGQADATLDGKRLRIGFRAKHDPSLRFETVLNPESTATVLDRIDQGFAGTAPSGMDIGALADAKLRRNEPCHCGSGKKFKKCCMRRPGAVPEAVRLLGEGIEDENVQFCLEIARRDAYAERDPAFWIDFGSALATSGNKERGESAWRKALEINPGEPGALLNLAVHLALDGKQDDAIALIKSVPIGTPRRSVILANTLMDCGRLADAIPLYEQAIAEEPGFDLPYERLVMCLSRTDSPVARYWLERGRKAVPGSASLAAAWCRSLFHEGRMEELAKAGWVDRLQSRVGDADMIDRRQSDPVLIVEAHLWRACAQVTVSASEDAVAAARELLAAYRDLEGPCEPAKGLLWASVLRGDSDTAEFAWGLLCEHCRKNDPNRSLDYYLAAAAHTRGDWAEVVSRTAAILGSDPENVEVLSRHWWALDEVGRIEEAVIAAEKVRGLRAHLSPDLDYHLDYNLGFLCGRAGLHGKAQYYYEQQLKREPSHPYAAENLAVAFVMNGHPEKAEALIPCWRIERGRATGVGALERDVEEAVLRRELDEKEQSLRRLIEFGKAQNGSPTYSLDVAEFRDGLSPFVGSDLMGGREWLSTRDLLEAMNCADEARRAEVMRTLEMQAHGDHSPIFQALREEVAEWDTLPLEARRSVVEAERRLREKSSIDYAPVVVCFAKAVEISLKSLVFDSFKEAVSVEMDVTREVQVAMSDRYKQVHNLVRFIEKGQPMELGTMLFALRLTTGKTANELHLLGGLRDFIRARLGIPELTTPDVFTALERLSKHRNLAAHATSATRETAVEVRGMALQVLPILTAAHPLLEVTVQ